jgi:hypothetical protein
MTAAAKRAETIARKAEQVSTEFSDACDALAADPNKADELKVRMATCQHCQGWVLQSASPRCDTDRESKKEFAKCMAAGMNIGTVTLTEARKVKHCNCKR